MEQIQSDIPQDVFQARVDLVYEHGTRALANSSSHSNLFLMPVWRALGRAMWLVRGKTLPKTLAVCGAVLLAALALVFYQMDMDLEAEGTLQPNVQRVVFAQVDGRVEDVLVKFNQTVQANEVLLRLENKELDIQISDLLGQQSQTQEELSSIAATVRQITGQVMDDSEAQKLLARKNQLTVQARTLGEKLRLLQEKQRSLVVRAPIAGVITSWEPRKTLLNRPVQTGQAILEIADLDQPMHIEARLPEKKISHLDRYTKAQLADSPSYNELPAEFILVSDPDTVLNGALPLNEIGLRAEPDETEGAVVRLRVNPDWEALSKMNPKPGTKVTTNLKCGKRSA
ncbi:MAG: HlyD family efflux transporter periplasmic adaptor subunit, partial [Planctomycetota bacterium]